MALNTKSRLWHGLQALLSLSLRASNHALSLTQPVVPEPRCLELCSVAQKIYMLFSLQASAYLQYAGKLCLLAKLTHLSRLSVDGLSLWKFPSPTAWERSCFSVFSVSPASSFIIVYSNYLFVCCHHETVSKHHVALSLVLLLPLQCLT